MKQIVGSTLTSSSSDVPETNFVSTHSPSYYAELYKRDNLPGGHIIMLGPGNEDAACQALEAYPGGLQVGGGIRPENAELWMKRGAMGVIVTSYCFKDGEIVWENVEQMRSAVGKENLVLDLSCRWKETKKHNGADGVDKDGRGSYFICTDRWQKWTDFELVRENVQRLEGYCGELLVHAVDVEGKKQGIDRRLVRLLGDICSIPVTYAGGVTCLDDLEVIGDLGRDRVDATVGSALDIFGGYLEYEDCVQWQNSRAREYSSERFVK